MFLAIAELRWFSYYFECGAHFCQYFVLLVIVAYSPSEIMLHEPCTKLAFRMLTRLHILALVPLFFNNLVFAQKKWCPPQCNNQCTDADEKCPWLYQVPGGDLIGHPVDLRTYVRNTVDTTSSHSVTEAVIVGDGLSLFNSTPDFVNGLWDHAEKGTVKHYVLPFSVSTPVHVGLSDHMSSFSNSKTSSATSWTMNAGLSANVAIVSVSASVSAGGTSTHADSVFSGSAKAYDHDYIVALKSDAPFSTTLLQNVGDYDGTTAMMQKYTQLFEKIGLYFVSEVTLGGYYEYTTTVKTASDTDSSQYAIDFKAKVAFITASGGGSHSSSDAYHNNTLQQNVHALGGEDDYRAKLMGYQASIKNETINLANWQQDYTNWLESVPDSPVAVSIKLQSLTTRFDQTGGLNPQQAIIVDNLHMAYDELFTGVDGSSDTGLKGNRITILRLQYGVKSDFDTPADPTMLNPEVQFIELPTSLKSLPYNSSTNTGFSTQYDLSHTCPSAQSAATEHKVGRTLRYTEYCDPSTNLLKCDGLDWCDLLTPNNMGRDPNNNSALNAELWVRMTFVAGAGNEVQTVDFKPCGYGAAWAIYWNEHNPYNHNRSKSNSAKIVGPFYNSVEGGGPQSVYSDAAKDLFPCTAANNMGGFNDGTDPACCDALASDQQYMRSQEVGCPGNCVDESTICIFPQPAGPLHCSKKPREIWRFTTQSGISAEGVLSPDGSVLYIPAGNNTYALNTKDGSKKWTFRAEGFGVLGAGVLSPDGSVLYIGSSKLYALNTNDGSTKWKSDGGGRMILSPDGSVLYFRGGDGGESVIALNTHDGSKKFEYECMNNDDTGVLSPDGSVLYITCRNSDYPEEERLNWVDTNNISRSGQLPTLWSLVEGTDSAGVMSLDGSWLYICLDGLYAFNIMKNSTNIVREWRKRITANGFFGEGVLPPDGSVLYIPAGNTTYALNTKDGSTKWTFATQDLVTTPVLSSDGSVLYIGSKHSNSTYALNTINGSQKWTFATQGPVMAAGVLSPDGSVLYIGSMDGNVYALNTFDGFTASAGLSSFYPEIQTQRPSSSQDFPPATSITVDQTSRFETKNHNQNGSDATRADRLWATGKQMWRWFRTLFY